MITTKARIGKERQCDSRGANRLLKSWHCPISHIRVAVMQVFLTWVYIEVFYFLYE